MKAGFLIVASFLLTCESVSSQVVSSERSRFRFAQSALGFSLYATTNGKTAYSDDANQTQKFDFSPQLYPALHIGGLHFWNRMEFFFSIPLGQLLPQTVNKTHTIEFTQGDIFGAKIFPWKLGQDMLRPFVGASVSGINYQQKSDHAARSGAKLSKFVFPLQLGFSWKGQKAMIDLAGRFLRSNELEYYISRSSKTKVEIPQFSFGLVYKRLLDGTVASEQYHYSGKEEDDYRRLKNQGKLSSFFVAGGPSVGVFTPAFLYKSTENPYLGRHLVSNTFFDASVGYFFEPGNAFVGLAYRSYTSSLKAYKVQQWIERKSILLELNKHLLDYQGFVPFLGIGIGFEQLSLSEKEDDIIRIHSSHQFAPGIIVGWDILPTRLEYMTLRTNVRFFPTLSIFADDVDNKVSQLEINIIQLVFYPQRFFRLIRMGDHEG